MSEIRTVNVGVKVAHGATQDPDSLEAGGTGMSHGLSSTHTQGPGGSNRSLGGPSPNGSNRSLRGSDGSNRSLGGGGGGRSDRSLSGPRSDSNRSLGGGGSSRSVGGGSGRSSRAHGGNNSSNRSLGGGNGGSNRSLGAQAVGSTRRPSVPASDELRPTPNVQGVRDVDLESRLQWAGPLGTLDSIIKAQRRIKGVIVSISNAADSGPGGSSGAQSCRIASEYGEFPFNLAAIKINKRFPDHVPQAKDRCEFKVSQTNPPKATSIRIAIPSSEVAAGEKAPGPKATAGSAASSSASGGNSLGGATYHSGQPSPIGVGAAPGTAEGGSSAPGQSNTVLSAQQETGYSYLTGYSASTTGNSMTQSAIGNSLGGAGGGGGTGLDDLCLGLQGMANGSPFLSDAA